MPLPKAPTKPATILVAIPSEPARPERAVRSPRPVARGPEPTPSARPTPATRLAVVESKPRVQRQQAAEQRAPEALRARHQRADARLDEPVPLRGARRLPADDDAGGTRLAQEGHVRSRAQRAPGIAHARFAGGGLQDADRRRHTAERARQQGCSRAALLPDPGRGRRTAAEPAGRQGRQPDPRCRACTQGPHSERDVVLVSKDINMRVKARALGLPAEDYYNDKVLEDTDILYTGVAQLPRELLGQERQGHGVVAVRRLHLLPDHRTDRRRPAGQSVRLSGKRHQLLRAGARDPRQVRGAARAA